MNEGQRYNGWLNYPTWNVALWIDNDEGWHEMWVERTEELVADHGKEGAVSRLAEELEADLEESKPEVVGVYADLLTWVLEMVDWYEIAEHFVDDVEIEDKDEE
jgi:hypothetical protein